MKTALWVITFVGTIIIPGHLVFGGEAAAAGKKPMFMDSDKGSCTYPYYYDVTLKRCRLSTTYEDQKSESESGKSTRPCAPWYQIGLECYEPMKQAHLFERGDPETFMAVFYGNYREWSRTFLARIWCEPHGIMCDLTRPETSTIPTLADVAAGIWEYWCWDQTSEHYVRGRTCKDKGGFSIVGDPFIGALQLVELATLESEWRRTRKIWQDWALQVQQQSQKAVREAVAVASGQCHSQQGIEAMQRELNYKLDMMQRKQDIDAQFQFEQAVIQNMMMNQMNQRYQSR